MNISFSKDYGTINVSIDELNYDEDIYKIHTIEKMMNSEGWQNLMFLFLKGREGFDTAVMKVKPQEQSFRETAIHAARLNGFWEAVSLATKVAEASKKFRESKLKEMEEVHEEPLEVNE